MTLKTDVFLNFGTPKNVVNVLKVPFQRTIPEVTW